MPWERLRGGALLTNMPVLLFCIAFGLSMDYEELFLVAGFRVLVESEPRDPREEASQRCAASDEASLGVARASQVITAAALVMYVVRRVDRCARVVHADRPRPDFSVAVYTGADGSWSQHSCM